jgi:DNA-binding beta-propeller fold protein YncE
MQYILFVTSTYVIAWVFFQFIVLVSNPWLRSFAVTIVVAVNNLSGVWLAERVKNNKGVNLFFAIIPGIPEIFLPQSYFIWLREQLGKAISSTPNPDRSWAAGILCASLLALFIWTPFNNQRILTAGELLHADSTVVKFADGDYNWIELNPATDELYAVGYYSNFIMIFNTNEIKAPPRKSKTSIDGAQSFGFNPDLQQVYIYNHMARELVYLDAPDLTLARTLPIPDLSNGDVWVKWNQLTDTIVLSSEADLNIGTPFYLLDRENGSTQATMPLPIIPTAYIVFHPEKPILYFNSFKDTYLAAWDMEKHQITQQTETSPRTDRMTLSPDASELLVASPMEGTVLRYDLETLDFKGKINTSFGDRTMAVDPDRNLLFMGNFINNRLTIIDYKTLRVIRSFYLGPWIRTIALDTENGVAYVSTVRHLFKVTYAEK